MAATKHGLSMKVMQRLCMLRLPKRHKKFKTENCGIVINESHPFVSASPDLKVSYVKVRVIYGYINQNIFTSILWTCGAWSKILW